MNNDGVSRRAAAHRYMKGELDAPTRYGDITIMRAKVKSGRAASLRDGVAHQVREAALIADGDVTVLAARWECGAGSVNAVPVVVEAPFAACHHCAEAVRLPRGPVVYRCYAEDGDLLYIGSSIKLHQRIRGHRANTRWWDEVADIKAEQFPTEGAARMAEARAIANEQPAYNRMVPKVAP